MSVAVAPSRPRGIKGYLRNPWRRPRFLQLTTILYLLWSLLPVVLAVIFSFNDGRSRVVWQGFSLRWWSYDPTDSILHDAAIKTAMVQTYKLSIATVVIAVPIGTLFAIGIDRWHGRPARAANFTMLLSFVVPEIILGVSLYILFTNLLSGVVSLGTNAQLLGLISFQISYPVIIVRARLLSIGPEYEEAAMDLGANGWTTFRKVTLPVIAPAVLSAALLGFALSVDDFVITYFVSGSEITFPLFVWGAARVGAPPQVNVIGSAIFIVALTAMLANVLFQRRRDRA